MTTAQELDLAAQDIMVAVTASGHITSAQQLMASQLARISGLESTSALLATTLTIAATMSGSVCVDLAGVAGLYDLGESDAHWPDTDEWCAALRVELAAVGADCPIVLEGTRVYLERYWRHEQHLATQLGRRRAMAPATLPVEAADQLLALFPSAAPDPTEPEDRQVIAARVAATRQLTVVAGGPGTGKTATIARIFALLTQQARADGRRPDIALAAPTGRAAARLTEALQTSSATIGADDDVRDRMRDARPATLHRLLSWQPQHRSRFRFNAANPLPFDVVIVDECSMVSLALMDQLVDALAPGTRLVLVGDPQQLASVEAGSVFGDIVGDVSLPLGDQLAVGTVVLNRDRRFGNEIAQLAQAVLAGDFDAVMASLPASDAKINWVSTSAEALTAAATSEILAPAVENWRALRARAQANELRDCIELSARSRILCGPRLGPFGVAQWNRIAYANVFGANDAIDRWYSGRPILVNKNDYQLDVFNGDIGVVVGTDSEQADRVVFERADGPLVVATNRLAEVDTAYASTVHKAQGSQFHDVIVVLPPQDSRLMSRELLYTAITRAQHSVTIVGDADALRAAVETRTVRQSGLRSKLAAASRGTPCDTK